MDTFVDSSWYFIRYLDPRNEEAAWDREAVGENPTIPTIFQRCCGRTIEASVF